MSLFGVGAYYNEFDPYAAAWLRNLIAAGHIAPGDVDTRSILDVSPDDLRGYAQCHFFAWIDLVQTDLEALGYAVGAIAFPSAGVGAPHIRDRTYWVGHADHARLEGHAGHGGAARWAGQDRPVAEAGVSGGLANTDGGADRGESEIITWANVRGLAAGDGGGGAEHGTAGPTYGFWRDADWLGCRDGRWRPVEPGTFPLADGVAGGVGRVRADQERLAALLPRKDQGSRVGRLRGYGNAINAEAAQAFIEALMECQP